MEKNEQGERKIWGLALFLASVAETAVCGQLLGKNAKEIINGVLWIALLSGTVLLYLAVCAERSKKGQNEMAILFVSVLFSLPCAYFYGQMKPMTVFYLGAVLIAALTGIGNGVIFSFYLCTAALLGSTEKIENAVALFVLCIVLSILAAFLRTRKYVLETGLLAEIVTAILFFLRTGMQGIKPVYKELGLELFSTAVLLCCAVGVIQFYFHLVPQKEVHETVAQTNEAEVHETVEKTNEAEVHETVERTGKTEVRGMERKAALRELEAVKDASAQFAATEIYTPFLQEDAPLLVRLRSESDKLYKNAEKLEEIVTEAALQISADAQRCKVIAMYHEIGKLEDKKSYIAAGTLLMQEAGMPEEIIRDISVIHEKDAVPHSKEAVIVLLALHIINTLNYLKLHQGNFTTDKVVDNAFSVLLQKGVLDESGLSLKEYRQLKKTMLLKFTFQ